MKTYKASNVQNRMLHIYKHAYTHAEQHFTQTKCHNFNPSYMFLGCDLCLGQSLVHWLGQVLCLCLVKYYRNKHRN